MISVTDLLLKRPICISPAKGEGPVCALPPAGRHVMRLPPGCVVVLYVHLVTYQLVVESIRRQYAPNLVGLVNLGEHLATEKEKDKGGKGDTL